MNILLVDGTDGDDNAAGPELIRFLPSNARIDVARSPREWQLLISGGFGYDLVLGGGVAEAEALALLEALRSQQIDAVVYFLVDQEASESADRLIRNGASGILARATGILPGLLRFLDNIPDENDSSYQMLFECNPHPMWIYDIQTLTYLAVNPAAVQKYGYTRDEFLAMTIADMHPMEEIPRLISNVAAVTAGLDEAGEWRHRLKDGRIIDVEILSHVTRFKGRRAELVLVTDVSQRRTIEKALRLSEERYRRLYNETPIMLHSIDSIGCLERVNDYWLEILGYTREEVIGKPWVEFLTTNSKGYALQEVLPVFFSEGSIRDVPYEVKSKDGSVHYVLLSASAERDSEGNIIRSRAALKDITDRKLAELRLDHTNRILRAIREIDQLIVREKDPKALIDETCRLLVNHRGYDGALILLTDHSGAVRMHAGAGLREDPSFFLGSHAEEATIPCFIAAREDNGIFFIPNRSGVCARCPLPMDHAQSGCMSIQLKRGDITYGYLGVSVVHLILIDRDEEVLFAELARDVAFALYNIDLEKGIEEANKQKEAAEAALRQSQKLEAVGRLAGGVAHDFNNMLNVILGYAGVALSRLDSNNPVLGDLRQIQKAAERSADLTQQLLAFSRKQVVIPRIIDLNEAVADQKKMLERIIGEDINFVFLPGTGLWNVNMDRSQVCQILANLVVNARDAVQEGGTITIETKNVILDEPCQQEHFFGPPGEYVLLSVSDTGIGMAPEVQDQIFEPFFTTKEMGKGTGLGLSTVYGIVKQNEGLMNVYSEPGIGTTFNIYFPSAYGETHSTPELPNISEVTGKETILVVEDEPQLLSLVIDILQEYGYSVLAAESAARAFEISENQGAEIRLLISDVIMPDMNGKEMEAKLKSMLPDLKTLFMSGYPSNIIAGRGILGPGVSFIQKPFSMTSLINKVREILDG